MIEEYNKKLLTFKGLVIKYIIYSGYNNKCIIVFNGKDDSQSYNILTLIDVFHCIDIGISKKQLKRALIQKLGHGYFHSAERLNLDCNLYFEIVLIVEYESTEIVTFQGAAKNILIDIETKTFRFPEIKDW